MSPDLDPLLDVLRRDVPGVVAVYLFGSHAAGTEAPSSGSTCRSASPRPRAATWTSSTSAAPRP